MKFSVKSAKSGIVGPLFCYHGSNDFMMTLSAKNLLIS